MGSLDIKSKLGLVGDVKPKKLDLRLLSYPDLQKIALFLKSSLPSFNAISIERRVEIFSGKDAIAALLNPQLKNYPLPEAIASVDRAKQLLLMLVSKGFFIKANINGVKQAPQNAMQQAINRADSISGATSQKNSQPSTSEIIYIVSPDPSLTWTDDIKFIWLYEGSQYFSLLLSFGIIVAIFAVVMYPLWPYSLRLGAWYLSMGGLSLVGLLIVISILRLALYLLSLTVGLPGFWLFPNLNEDCGVIESFIPLYSWDAIEEKEKK